MASPITLFYRKALKSSE